MVCLYSKTESAFTDNGICVLDPVVCTVAEEAGGSYELYLEHPIDEHRKCDLLATDMIIRAPVPPTVIPEITLPACTRYTVSNVDDYDFMQSLPVVKNKATKDELSEVRANPAAHTYSAHRGFNKGALVVYNGGIYRARGFCFNVLPGTDADLWMWIAPLYGSGTNPPADYKPGVKYNPGLTLGAFVLKIAEIDSVNYQIKDTLGRIGFINKNALTEHDIVQETIAEQTITEQLFRIYQIESDEDSHLIKVYAKHISYDFQGNSLMDCKIQESKPLDAIAVMQSSLMIADNRRIACQFTDEDITQDWSFKNPINALLDPDTGLVPQLKARLVRNNHDFFILTDDETDPVLTIEHGNNMTGVTWHTNSETQISRVVPRCRNGSDDYLYLEHGGTWSDPDMADEHWVQNDDIYVDSPIASSFYAPKIQVLECNFAVGEEYKPAGATEGIKRDEANCRAEMLKQAQDRFRVDHADGSETILTVEFVLLGDTEQYRQYKGLQRVNIYDRVKIRTNMVEAVAKVTEYEYDSLRGRYNSITVGTVDSFNRRIPGYRVVNESITYAKLSPDLVSRIWSEGSRSSDAGSSGGSSGSAGGGGVDVGGPDVVDNLTSTSTTDALSANQGKVLKGLIDAALVSTDGISGGGSKAYNLANSTKLVLVTFCATAGGIAVLVVNVNSSGAVRVADVIKGSDVSYTTTTRKITISNGGTNSMAVRALVFDGSIST